MPINPLQPNPLVPNAAQAASILSPNATAGSAGLTPGLTGAAGTAATGLPAVGATPFGLGAPASPLTPPAGAAAQNPMASMLPQVLSIIQTLVSMLGGGAAVGGTSAARPAGAASAGAGPAAAGGPVQRDESISNRANQIIQQGLGAISGIGAGQARTAIQNGLGNAIGAVNVNGVQANLNFSVNDLRDTLSFARGLGLTAQNGRIDQAQLQGAIQRAESSGAPANVVNTLRSLNENWGAGEQLGIIQGGALTSGGIDRLMGILEQQAQGAAQARGGIAASVGGRAVTNVFNTIRQPVRDLIRDSIGL